MIRARPMAMTYPCTGKFRLLTWELNTPSVGGRLSESKADMEENISEKEKGRFLTTPLSP